MKDGAHGNAEPVQRLDYANRPALPWVNRHHKLLILLAMLVAIATPIWWHWAPLKHRALWLYWSHRAAAFEMPDHSVDLSVADPLEAKRIATTNPSYVFPTVSRRAMGIDVFPTATFVPLEFRQLLKLDPRMRLAGTEYTAVAFMGTRFVPMEPRALSLSRAVGGL